RDDDGDGEVDEDLRMGAQQILAADYVDDRPEALHYIYEGSESHRPLHLSVHQEVYGWAMPGYQNIAGLQFQITNHGTEVLRDLYVGLFADLDVRRRADLAGHLDDLPFQAHFWTLIRDDCTWRPERSVPVLADGPSAGRGAASVFSSPTDRRGGGRESTILGGRRPDSAEELLFDIDKVLDRRVPAVRRPQRERRPRRRRTWIQDPHLSGRSWIGGRAWKLFQCGGGMYGYRGKKGGLGGGSGGGRSGDHVVDVADDYPGT